MSVAVQSSVLFDCVYVRQNPTQLRVELTLPQQTPLLDATSLRHSLIHVRHRRVAFQLAAIEQICPSQHPRNPYSKILALGILPWGWGTGEETGRTRKSLHCFTYRLPMSRTLVYFRHVITTTLHTLAHKSTFLTSIAPIHQCLVSHPCNVWISNNLHLLLDVVLC